MPYEERQRVLQLGVSGNASCRGFQKRITPLKISQHWVSHVVLFASNSSQYDRTCCHWCHVYYKNIEPKVDVFNSLNHGKNATACHRIQALRSPSLQGTSIRICYKNLWKSNFRKLCTQCYTQPVWVWLKINHTRAPGTHFISLCVSELNLGPSCFAWIRTLLRPFDDTGSFERTNSGYGFPRDLGDVMFWFQQLMRRYFRRFSRG